MISKKRDMAVRWTATLLVLIFAAAVLLPIWWIFRSSLMSTSTINQYPPEFIPHEWLWSNYSKALETFDYWLYFKNTFTIIIPAVTFGTITAIFCGYAFARLRFRGKNVFFKICVGTILLPGIYFLDKRSGTGRYLLAADSSIFNRWWIFQHFPDPAVPDDHSDGAG